MSTLQDYRSDAENQWCPGCPNFGILTAVKKALVELGKAPHEVCLVSGIGQAAKLPHYLRCNFFNGLHGRALPAALGIHASNPELTTLVVTGEGDCYGEGGNHFLHTLRRNPDITLLVHNNEVYALTKGQASPTTPAGEARSLHQKGVEAMPLNMPALAILHGCTFVARGFAGDLEQLQSLIVEAVRHRGFSYLDVIQPCITWGPHPVSWYRERVHRLPSDYDASDRSRALEAAQSEGGRWPTGVLYRGEPRPTFAARFRETVTGRPLAALPPVAPGEVRDFLETFRAGRAGKESTAPTSAPRSEPPSV